MEIQKQLSQVDEKLNEKEVIEEIKPEEIKSIEINKEEKKAEEKLCI